MRKWTHNTISAQQFFRMLQPIFVWTSQPPLVLMMFFMVFLPYLSKYLIVSVCINGKKSRKADLLICVINCSSIDIDILILQLTCFCKFLSMWQWHKQICQFSKLLLMVAISVARESLIKFCVRDIRYLSLCQFCCLANSHWVSEFIIMSATGTPQPTISCLISTVYKAFS